MKLTRHAVKRPLVVVTRGKISPYATRSHDLSLVVVTRGTVCPDTKRPTSASVRLASPSPVRTTRATDAAHARPPSPPPPPLAPSSGRVERTVGEPNPDGGGGGSFTLASQREAMNQPSRDTKQLRGHRTGSAVRRRRYRRRGSDMPCDAA